MKASPQYAPADADGTIPLKSRENFKLYEPIILLLALNLEMRKEANYINPAETCDTADPKQLFKAFLNKLALVCDSDKGGATVTSIWASENKSGEVEYCIASNQRKATELDLTATYVTTILRAVRDSPSQDHANRELLPPILRFNRPRINFYLNQLREEADKCLVKCADLSDENDDAIAPELQILLDLCPVEPASRLPEPEFSLNCQAIIQRLIRLDRSPAGARIEYYGRTAREANHEDCWSELRHMMSRLIAYRQSVAFFFRTKATFPRLFTSFIITTLPSSRPLPKPVVRNKSLTAESIVGRLTRVEEDIKTFRAFVEGLQLYSLDDRILKEFTRDTFRPVVHSEMLLLNRIEFSGGISPARFFNKWKYIGSSKPTCKLCSYHFQEHKSGVEHRSSHGNLYPSWRLPDVREEQGAVALKRREEMLKKMLRRVRQDAFDLVRRRVAPTHRNHDSVTSSARMTLEERWSTTSSVDDLVSVLGGMGLDDDDDGDDDGGSGGVRL